MSRLITYHIWACHNYRYHDRSGACLENSSDSYPMAHGAMTEGTSNNGEKISNVQKTKPKCNKWDQKGRARSYADMTIYAIDPAGTVSTMCPHKRPTTIVIFHIPSNLWIPHCLFMAKMHAMSYSAHLCCSVDSQGQGKAQRFAGQVQRWPFVAFQLAIGWYSLREIPGALHFMTAMERSLWAIAT